MSTRELKLLNEMAKTTDIKRIEFDPYEVLGLQPQCEENEIDRAFKKSALKWHPDKNLTNKDKAEEMFIKIYRAYEFLKDKEARVQYDQQRAAKLKRAQYEEQRRATDSTRRRKLIEDLEAREAAATDIKRSKMPEYHQAPSRAPRDDKLEELRKQGAEMLRKMQAEFAEKEREQAERLTKASTSKSNLQLPTLKLRWKTTEKSQESPYDENKLRQIFGKHGKMETIIISKGGSAIIEFLNVKDVDRLENEAGDAECPFKLKWLYDSRPKEKSFMEPEKPSVDIHANKAIFDMSHAEMEDFEAQVLQSMFKNS
uniref:J domain-containing protein n=1 Tax=Acrobeloides nanus TaxID=290746 RepID=A0A914DR33_9BILA